MHAASSETGQELNPSGKRAASRPVRDLPAASVPGRSRVVIRLPDLASDKDASAEAASSAGSSATSSFAAAAPSGAEEPTMPSLANQPSPPPTVANEVAPPAGSIPVPGGTDSAAAAPHEMRRSGFFALSAAWRLVRQGHAFVMQPKIWLACVLACIGLLLAVFFYLPPVESDEAPAATFEIPALPEAAALPPDVATQIVAPPAETSSSDPRAYDLQSSAGALPPYFGETPETATGAGGEEVRVAAEARLGPGGMRGDNQAPTEPGGATINEVAPLGHPDSGPHEGRTLR